MTDYEIVRVVRVVDGDTVDAHLRREVGVLDGWTLTAARTVRLRLIHLDTPERGQDGYTEATEDLAEWLVSAESFTGLRALVADRRDPFGRYLADIYEADDRSATASEFMLRHANGEAGWPAYTPS